jgi:ACS family pantothenate transporter-like MFS transporter
VYCCAAYFFNYLDRSAFANAYVSGLKEDLRLEGNQYSILLSMFTAGSCVGQIPHALIIQKLAPRFWLPFTLLVWSGLTMSSAACKTYTQLCVVRFLQGFFESSLYSGTIYILGSWYKPLEISKRTAIFTAIGQIGSMFAGVMMTAMNESLHGQTSLKGWQWVFIISEYQPQGHTTPLTSARWRYGYSLQYLWTHVLSQFARIHQRSISQQRGDTASG